MQMVTWHMANSVLFLALWNFFFLNIFYPNLVGLGNPQNLWNAKGRL